MIENSKSDRSWQVSWRISVHNPLKDCEFAVKQNVEMTFAVRSTKSQINLFFPAGSQITELLLPNQLDIDHY